MTPRWANVEEQTRMQNKVEAVVAAVLAQASPFSLRAARPAVIDLESISRNVGNVTMPTLNGWFLGYPVCYAVHDLVNAESISRCLSTTTLKLYSILTKLDYPTPSGQSLDKEKGNAVLLAFSLPVNLVESDEWRERNEGWEETLRTRHREALAAEIPWTRLSIEETTCMKGIAL